MSKLNALPPNKSRSAARLISIPRFIPARVFIISAKSAAVTLMVILVSSNPTARNTYSIISIVVSSRAASADSSSVAISTSVFSSSPAPGMVGKPLFASKSLIISLRSRPSMSLTIPSSAPNNFVIMLEFTISTWKNPRPSRSIIRLLR